MPPVLSPVSPSPTGLWSWLAGMATTLWPSQKARNETSSPTSISSTMTSRPAAPNWAWTMICSRALTACSTVRQTTTPLPAARPSALMTMGAPFSSTKALARAKSSNTAKCAVGTPDSSMIDLANPLLPSSLAA